MAEAATLTGPQRAAIFLLGVGEQGAAAVMRHMAPREVQQVGEAMANLPEVSNEQIADVVQDFSQRVNAVSPIGIGASDFTRRVMVEALGENRARSVLSKVMQDGNSKGLDALKWMDARSVADVVRPEHPQIIALVLASLTADHAAQVMALLPEDLHADLVMRIARLDLVEPAALKELDQVIEKQLGDRDDAPASNVDGMGLAAEILNQMDSGTDTVVLDSVKSVDRELGEKISEMMFVFDNLLELDDRGMQRLIREISTDALVVALKGVDEKVQDKFFNNMSSRAADMLREDLEAKGPVKLSDVEAEQKAIIAIATKLADEGEIFLGKGGGDFV
jgi:flagellar motor switch protein FliG